MDSNQPEIPGLPQASYEISVYCTKCQHTAELNVGIDVLRNLKRLKCSQCGTGLDGIRVEMSSKAELGG